MNAQSTTSEDEKVNQQRHQRAQRSLMSDIPENPYPQVSTMSRKCADSHQPSSTTGRSRQSVHAPSSDQVHHSSISAYPRSPYDVERPRRYSTAEYGHGSTGLLPQVSPSNPYGEVRKLSGNWNAPTDIELQRDRDIKKSMKGVEKLRSKVRGWVRT